MKKYLEHIRSKEPHQRRRHALQLAGIATSFVFIIWISTLGMRLSVGGSESGEESDFQAAVATYEQASANSLMVASSTKY